MLRNMEGEGWMGPGTWQVLMLISLCCAGQMATEKRLPISCQFSLPLWIESQLYSSQYLTQEGRRKGGREQGKAGAKSSQGFVGILEASGQCERRWNLGRKRASRKQTEGEEPPANWEEVQGQVFSQRELEGEWSTGALGRWPLSLAHPSGI